MPSPQRRGSRDSVDGPFEEMLSGGHPNSLGRTVEVVDLVLADRDRLDELYGCYFSSDEVVRLRVSSAMKRVTAAHPDWTMDYMDRLQHQIAAIDQASTQWTLALLFDLTRALLSPQQRSRAVAIMQRNLAHHNDWIVLNTSMKVLGSWAEDDDDLRKWLKPHARGLAETRARPWPPLPAGSSNVSTPEANQKQHRRQDDTVCRSHMAAMGDVLSAGPQQLLPGRIGGCRGGSRDAGCQSNWAAMSSRRWR